MRLWTFHEPRDRGMPSAERADRVVVVKDGVTWLGLFFSLPWLLLNRLWLAFAGCVAAIVAVSVMGELFLSRPVAGLLGILPAVWVWLSGNDLRRGKLARRGFEQTAAVLARTAEEAELRYFASWEGDAAAPPRKGDPATWQRPAGGAQPVLGLFPTPGPTR